MEDKTLTQEQIDKLVEAGDAKELRKYGLNKLGKPLGGRPKGAPTLKGFKKKLREYMSENELKSIIKMMKQEAKSDKKVAMFMLEQIFGKARGTMGIDGGENKPITMAAVLDQLDKPNKVLIEPREAEVEKLD